MNEPDTRRQCLNVGSGGDYRKSDAESRWINCDLSPAVVCDVRIPSRLLPGRYPIFFDHIEANDILEHIPYSEDNQSEWIDALRAWIYCLKNGGTIRVQVPDIGAIMNLYGAGQIDHHTMNRVIFGESTNEFDRHYQTFTLTQLHDQMLDLGLKVITAEHLHVCAIVVARKTV